MRQNPFYHRGPIREPGDFFGRQRETQQVAGLLRVAQSVSVVGPRRVGKTSLLYHLQSLDVRATHGLLEPIYVFANINAEGLTQAPLAAVYAHILEALRDRLPKLEALQQSAALPDYHAVDAALKALTALGSQVTFFIDEFEALAANPNLDPSFFSGLRGLATRYAVSYVIASQQPLIALVYADHSVLSSPFFNIFATVPLGLFDESTAQQMVPAFLARARAALPEPALSAIAELSGPHPFFIQLAAYHACELARSTEKWDQRVLTRLADAFYDEAQSHYLYAWHNLVDAERYTLANLPAAQQEAGAREALRQLQDQCLIVAHPEGGYGYLSTALRRFVRCQQVPGLLQVEPLVIDLRRRSVVAGEELLPLTKTQFDLLATLAEYEGRVVTNRALEERVWKDEYVEDPERLKAAIKHLRRALGSYASCVINERGVGYALRGSQECR